jgi:branched-chain amino acid transport system permease protein
MSSRPTRRASQITATAAVAIFAVLVFLPFFAGRGLIQDMFFILTMLVLAQFWNLLAGYGGLVSIGQQAFVGMGAYAMFGGVILAGMDPIPAILIGGRRGPDRGRSHRVFCLPPARVPYFAIGTWVIAEVMRLVMAQVQSLGGGTGTSLPRSATREMWATEWIAGILRRSQLRRAGHTHLLAGARARGRHHRRRSMRSCGPSAAWPWRRSATTPKLRSPSA